MITLADAVTDPATATTIGGGIVAILVKWFILDLRVQRKEDQSRIVREDNLVMQTDLLRKLVKQRRKGNRVSKTMHGETHKLLKQLLKERQSE